MQFVNKPMVPYFYSVLPVLNHAIDNGPGEFEKAFFGGDLMANVKILLIHTDHLSGLFGSAYDGGEPGFWGVITRNAHFHESTAIVDN